MIKKEDLENNVDRLDEWIRAADQKVSIFLAFQGVILTILASAILQWDLEKLYHLTDFSLTSFVLAVFLFLYSTMKLVWALFPHFIEFHKKSLTFFGDIADFQVAEYQKVMGRLTDKLYAEELMEHICLSSKIIKAKYALFRDAVVLFLVGLLFLLIAVIVLFFLCFLFQHDHCRRLWSFLGNWEVAGHDWRLN